MTDKNENDWEQRVEACWNWVRSSDPQSGRTCASRRLPAAEHTADDPAALYERTSARDSAGLESEVDAKRRSQAVIQLASTLRNLGQLDENEQLLRAELDRCSRSSDGYALPDETRAFLALTLLARDKPVEAAALVLSALAAHLSRYSRSVSAYAQEISKTDRHPAEPAQRKRARLPKALRVIDEN